MRRRVIVCLALLLVLCLLGDLVAIVYLERSRRDLDALARAHRIQLMRSRLAADGLQIETGFLAFVLHRDKGEAYRRRSLRRFEASLGRCAGCHHEPDVRAELNRLKGSFAACKAGLDRLAASVDAAPRAALEEQAYEAVQGLTGHLTRVTDRAMRHLTASGADVADRLHRASVVLAGTVIAALLVGSLVALHLLRRLTRPLQALLAGIEQFQRGDLSHRFNIRGDREFRELGGALNRAHEGLANAHHRMFRAEKMAALGRLAAGVAHEVNNPLASLSSVVQLMRRDAASSQHEERMTLIMDGVNRIAAIVRELLAFSRPDDAQPVSRVDIAGVLDRAVQLLSYDPRAEDVRITRDYPPGVGAVRGHPERLVQVFMNLIVNGFDAIRARGAGGGTLAITARRENDRLVITFTDDGLGMTPEEVERAFDPFFTTKPPGEGTGLGLWLCYQEIQEHHGTIHVDSDPGRGTRVTVGLPCED